MATKLQLATSRLQMDTYSYIWLQDFLRSLWNDANIAAFGRGNIITGAVRGSRVGAVAFAFKRARNAAFAVNFSMMNLNRSFHTVIAIRTSFTGGIVQIKMKMDYEKRFKPILNELIMTLSEIQTDNDIAGLIFISHVCLNLIKSTSDRMRLKNEKIPPHLLNYQSAFYRNQRTTWPVVWGAPAGLLRYKDTWDLQRFNNCCSSQSRSWSSDSCIETKTNCWRGIQKTER